MGLKWYTACVEPLSVLSVLGFLIVVMISVMCHKNDNPYQLVPCLVWTAKVDTPAPEYCQVVLYKQELITFWKEGSVVKSCMCKKCPADKNITEAQCWYTSQAQYSTRFRDAPPNLGGCGSKVQHNLVIAILVFVALLLVSLLSLVLYQYLIQSTMTTSSALSSSQNNLTTALAEPVDVEPIGRVRALDRCETLCELGVTLCEDEVSMPEPIDEGTGFPMHDLSTSSTRGPHGNYARLSLQDDHEVHVAL